MKKSVIIGIIVLLLIVGGGLFYSFVIAPGQNATGTSSSGNTTQAVKPVPLSIATAAGYTLSSANLDGKQVPVLRVPLDTWGGYAALFAANGGAKPSAESLFYKLGGFAVELEYVEGAQAQLDGYAQGKYHILWSSMDSLPLLHDALKTDRRVVPQVIGLFDWSVGGDGIVVREGIRSPKDLKGKKILTSGNTPYSFFLLWTLAQSKLAPSDVTMLYVDDGQKALDVFQKDSSIAAWVTWEPYMSDLITEGSDTYLKGARLLISSKDANQLIADIFFTRNDLAREHPEYFSAFVEAMIQGQGLLEKNPEPVYAAMAAFYKLAGGPAEAKEMMTAVHIPNYTETAMFFDIANPINAYKIYYMSQAYNKGVGSLSAESNLEAEAVINTKFIEALASKGDYAKQTNRVQNSFNKQSAFDIADLESQRVVLSEDVQIYFDAQQIEFDLNGSSTEMAKNREILAKVAEQMNILGTTVLKLVGHLDTSKVEEFKQKGQQAFIEASAQAKLISKKRAEYIKKLLVERFKADPDRIFTEGRGWDQPIDSTDPVANRRVEVQFVGFE